MDLYEGIPACGVEHAPPTVPADIFFLNGTTFVFLIGNAGAK
jgi:hypothetical protein